MPALHTTIPDAALPTALTDPNKIVTRYESFTLIPRLGPLTYAYIRRDAWGRLWHFQLTLKLLDKLSVHKKVWKVIPDLAPVKLNAVWNIEKVGGVGPSDPLASARKPGGAARVDIAPETMLRAFRRLPGDSVSVLSGTSPLVTRRVTFHEAEEAASTQRILELMKVRNPVLESLAQSGKLLDDEGSIRSELLDIDAKKRLDVAIEAVAAENARPRDVLVNISKNVIENATAGEEAMFGELGAMMKADPKVRRRLADSIAGMLSDSGVLAGLNSLDDAAIVDSREWAFLRRERVELLLEAPQFRGPVGINSVAPNSELTISDTQTTGTQVFDIAASRRAERSGTNMLIAQQVKEKLGTLYDYGSNLKQTMSEQGYERDNSRGEKRTIVEQTLSEISETNASKTISISNVAATSLREYRTEGKDTNFAMSVAREDVRLL